MKPGDAELWVESRVAIDYVELLVAGNAGWLDGCVTIEYQRQRIPLRRRL